MLALFMIIVISLNYGSCATDFQQHPQLEEVVAQIQRQVVDLQQQLGKVTDSNQQLQQQLGGVIDSNQQLQQELGRVTYSNQQLQQQLKTINDRNEELQVHQQVQYQQIDAHRQQADAQSQQADAQSQQIDAQSQQIDAQSQEIDAQSQQIDAQSQQIDAQSQEMSSFYRQIQQLQERQNGFIAFVARRTTDIPVVSADTVIVYDNVTVNIGSGYDPTYGIFTAPVSGLYHFHTVTHRESVSVGLDINGVLYQYSEAGDSSTINPTTSNTVTVGLTAGDTVTHVMRVHGSSQSYCNNGASCQFAGFLLYQYLI